MRHVHEPPTVVREEIHESTDGGTGMGIVLGVILAVVVSIALMWFVMGARLFGTGTGNTTPQGQTPPVNIVPPNINIDKPNVTINPPAQNPPANQGSPSSGQ